MPRHSRSREFSGTGKWPLLSNACRAASRLKKAGKLGLEMMLSVPKKGVWNFEALEIPAFIGLGEFQTPFLGPCRLSCSGPVCGERLELLWDIRDAIAGLRHAARPDRPDHVSAGGSDGRPSPVD